MAIKTDRSLWAWGDNTHGQLGDGTALLKIAPVLTGEDNNWRSASAGSTHTVAVRTDGTLWTWGNNAEGRTGLGTAAGNTLVPTSPDVFTKNFTITVPDRAYQYVITGSGYSFTAKGYGTDGITTYTVPNGSNTSIQNVIDAVMADANGNATTITFGSGESTLDIGNANISLNNTDGTWGTVTLNGSLTSSFNTPDSAVILIDNADVISQADITGTSTAANVSVIRNNGTGTVEITSGTVRQTGDANNFAIWNNADGAVTISGTVSSTSGVAVNNAGTGTININGGTAGSTNGGTNAIVSTNTDSSVVLGNDPTIIGNINIAPGILSVNITDTNAFAPDVGKMYDVTLSGLLTPDLTAVVNGASFDESFTVNRAWMLEVKDNDLVLVRDLAYWYVVTFDPNNGIDSPTNTNVPMSPAEPTSRPADDPTNGSYVFNGWFREGTLWDFDSIVTSNMTLTAQWSYTVTFDPNNGGPASYVHVVISDTSTVMTGSDGTWTSDGYISDGKWYLDIGGINEFVFGVTLISDDTTLYLAWNAAPVTIDTTKITNGEFGKEYSFTLKASLESNVAGAITYDIIIGDLPPGLIFNGTDGIISGIPSDLGEFIFTVVAESIITGEKDDRIFTITIGGGYCYWMDEGALTGGELHFTSNGSQFMSGDTGNKFSSLLDAYNSGGTGTLVIVGDFVDNLNGMTLDFGPDVNIIFEAGATVRLENGVVIMNSIDISDGTLTLDCAKLILLEKLKDTNNNGAVELINSDVSAGSTEIFDLKVSGDVTMDGDVTVGTVTSFDDTDGPTDLTVNGSLDAGSVNIIGDVRITENMDVTGDTFIDGTLIVGGNMVTGAGEDGTGNVDIGGDLTTGGNAYIGGDLKTGTNDDEGSGNVDIGGDLTTGGNADIGGNLDAGGNLDVGGDASIGGNLVVGGGADIGGNLNTGTNEDDKRPGDVNVGDDLDIGGTADIGNDLNVGGDATFGDEPTVDGDTKVEGLKIVGLLSMYDYTGSPITPSITISSGGDILEEGIDYTLLFENNTGPGTAKVKITIIAEGERHGEKIVRMFTINDPYNDEDTNDNEGSEDNDPLLLYVIIGVVIIGAICGGFMYTRSRE